MNARRAVIAGATGLIGRELLDLLLHDGQWSQVTALTRRPLERSDPRLVTGIVDFDHLEQAMPDLAVQDAFCCLGTTLKSAGSRAGFEKVDYEYVLAFARLALRAGAQRFMLVSALGADADSLFFYTRTKGKAEVAVRALGFGAVHVMRPSLLLGERREFRPGEALATPLARLVAPLLRGPAARYRPVTARCVAQKMLDCALNDAQGEHVHFFEDGP